jgi:hypothetical protein
MRDFEISRRATFLPTARVDYPSNVRYFFAMS